MIRYILLMSVIIALLIAGNDAQMKTPQKITTYIIVAILFFLLSKISLLQ